LATPASSPHRFGVAFDIDGVLYRGANVIPKAPLVLEKLTEQKVPWVLVTNGGGITEEKKAQVLSTKLGVPIDPARIIQSHTPMKDLVAKYRDTFVLVVGSAEAKSIAKQYGFRNIVTTGEVHATFPTIYGDKKPHESDMIPDTSIFKQRIEAVVTFMDPLDYHRDLQIVYDVICGHGMLTGEESQHIPEWGEDSHLPLFFSGPDFLFVNEWHRPRFGSGLYPLLLKKLYQEATGGSLEVMEFGKPHPVTYRYAFDVLNRRAKESGVEQLDRIYMVGDNPHSDILGANQAGPQWRSVLVRTGVFNDPSLTNHPDIPADIVVPNVWEAYQTIMAENQ